MMLLHGNGRTASTKTGFRAIHMAELHLHTLPGSTRRGPPQELKHQHSPCLSLAPTVSLQSTNGDSGGGARNQTRETSCVAMRSLGKASRRKEEEH